LLSWFLDRLDPRDSEMAGEAEMGFETGVREIHPSLWNIPVPDSLSVIELVMEMEEVFDLNVSEEDAAQIKTIADAIRFLRKHRGEGE
jgi:hypothetical protein